MKNDEMSKDPKGRPEGLRDDPKGLTGLGEGKEVC